MKSNSNSNKISENENMPAGKPLVNQSFLENIEIKSLKGKKEIKNKENIIRMKFGIKEKDVGKAIKILYNIKEEIEGCDLKELNETNSELYINNKKHRYKTYIIPEKEGIYDIKIKSYSEADYDSKLYYLYGDLTDARLIKMRIDDLYDYINLIFGIM